MGVETDLKFSLAHKSNNHQSFVFFFLKTGRSTPAALKPIKEQMSQHTLLCKVLLKAEIENSWHHWVPSPRNSVNGNEVESRKTGS